MAGESIIKYLDPLVLEANGASIANNAIAQADDASYDVVANGSSYPHARFVLSATFAVAPTENTTLALYARPLDIDGTADADAPETTRPTVFIGTFVVNNVTTTQYLALYAEDVPWKADYYIHNNGTGQAVNAGWTLKLKPYTSAPAP